MTVMLKVIVYDINRKKVNTIEEKESTYYEQLECSPQNESTPRPPTISQSFNTEVPKYFTASKSIGNTTTVVYSEVLPKPKPNIQKIDLKPIQMMADNVIYDNQNQENFGAKDLDQNGSTNKPDGQTTHRNESDFEGIQSKNDNDPESQALDRASEYDLVKPSKLSIYENQDGLGLKATPARVLASKIPTKSADDRKKIATCYDEEDIYENKDMAYMAKEPFKYRLSYSQSGDTILIENGEYNR